MEAPAATLHKYHNPQDWEKKYAAQPISAEEWSVQRGRFTRLYITEDRSLNDVRRIMAERYGFFANPKQCKSAIKNWELEKNLNKAKMTEVLRIQHKRMLEGKDTAFSFNGIPVDGQTIERARKRHKGDGGQPVWEEPGATVATPSGVRYWTPEPQLLPYYNVSGVEWEIQSSHPPAVVAPSNSSSFSEDIPRPSPPDRRLLESASQRADYTGTSLNPDPFLLSSLVLRAPESEVEWDTLQLIYSPVVSSSGNATSSRDTQGLNILSSHLLESTSQSISCMRPSASLYQPLLIPPMPRATDTEMEWLIPRSSCSPVTAISNDTALFEDISKFNLLDSHLLELPQKTGYTRSLPNLGPSLLPPTLRVFNEWELDVPEASSRLETLVGKRCCNTLTRATTSKRLENITLRLESFVRYRESLENICRKIPMYWRPSREYLEATRSDLAPFPQRSEHFKVRYEKKLPMLQPRVFRTPVLGEVGDRPV